jgi:hypothetical protein
MITIPAPRDAGIKGDADFKAKLSWGSEPFSAFAELGRRTPSGRAPDAKYPADKAKG